MTAINETTCVNQMCGICVVCTASDAKVFYYFGVAN